MTARNSVVLWDIDNSLGDDRHRVPLIDWHLTGNERYLRYNEFMRDDEPANMDFFELFRAMGVTPIFFTGRSENYREWTESWLREWGFIEESGEFELHMRGIDERLTPADLKQRMLVDFLQAHSISEILCAFDDHRGIVDMYRSHGIRAAVLLVHELSAYDTTDHAPAKPLTL